MAVFPQLACQAPQMPQYLPWSTWLQRDPLKRWAPPGGAFPNLLPNSHFVIHGWDHLRKRGPGRRGGRAKPKTDTKRARTLPAQARMQIPSPSQNASAGFICEQKSPRRAVSASLLSLSAPPAWRQPGESPTYLFAASAEANGSTMDLIGPGSGRAFFLAPGTTSPFHLHHLQDPGALNEKVASSAGRRRRRGEI